VDTILLALARNIRAESELVEQIARDAGKSLADRQQDPIRTLWAAWEGRSPEFQEVQLRSEAGGDNAWESEWSQCAHVLIARETEEPFA
jgi:hypothetical protein